MWNAIRPISENNTQILDTDFIKLQLNEYADDNDDLINHLALAAQRVIQGPRGIGVSLLNSQYRLALPYFMARINLLMTPIVSVESVQWRDTSNNLNTVDPSIYYVDLDTSPAQVTLNYNCFWPQVILPFGKAVYVNFTAGFGDTADDVPDDLKHAMLLLIGHWYQNREAVVGIGRTDSPTEVPMTVDYILDRYRAAAIA